MAECLLAGILTVGGFYGSRKSTAEIFNPRSGRSCKIGDIPVATDTLSFCGNLACGGEKSMRSCSRFDGRAFQTTPVTLKQRRRAHSCWPLQSGQVLLLGGFDYPTTTERLSADGSSSTLDFDLPYKIEFVLNPMTNNNWYCHCSQACGIELNGNFILTGGSDVDTGVSLKTVAEFTETGQVTYLPDLQTGRSYHTCSKFVDDTGETVSFSQ